MRKYSIHFKVWLQIIKYFIRLVKSTNNIKVNDAFACAIAQNTRWVQTVMRLLKVNGFYDAFSAHIISTKILCKISEYLNLQENENYQYQSYLEKIRIVEHRKTFTKLRAGSTCLSVEKGRHQDIFCEKSVFPTCENGIEDLKHFLLGCKKPREKRTQFIITLNNVT